MKFGAEETAEAADLAEHLGAVRSPDEVLDAALDAVAEIHIHAGGGVGFLFVIRSRISQFAWEATCLLETAIEESPR